MTIVKGISLHVDAVPLLAMAVGALAFYWLWRWRRTFAEPHVAFSDISSLISGGRGRAAWGNVPRCLMVAALAAFACAFVNPSVLLERPREKSGQPSEEHPLPVEGIAIYLVLDQSGSMAEEVRAQTASGQRQTISKLRLLKQVTEQFIGGDAPLGLKGRPNDLIGIIAFARGAQVLVPLTLDHAAVLAALSNLDIMREKDQDGTSIGYAIFKAANMIAATRHYSQELVSKGEPGYTIKNTVMILITDGLQDPNPLDKGKRLRNMDVPEAAAYARQQGIRLYIVNVEPKLATEEFAPYRHIMQRAAEVTGGRFFMVDSSNNLQQIYQEIDQLEKSALPQPVAYGDKLQRPDLYRRVAFYPYLLTLGLTCLLAAIYLETFALRRIP